MSNFSALNAAVTGLHAHRQRIDVIGENIANINTPGYHRQLTDLTPVRNGRAGLFSGPGGEHGGVDASVRRRWDSLLESNVNRQQSRASSLGAQAAAMENLEGELGALGGGLAAKLQELWDGFDDLANNPDDPAVRNVVLGNASAVAAALNRDGTAIDDARRNAAANAEILVGRINELASSIAELDTAVLTGSAGGSVPSGVLDQRDRLITELSSLVNIDVVYQENGQAHLSIDGHNLVSNGQSKDLQLTTSPDAALGTLGYDRISLATPAGRALNPTGGMLHGALQLANDVIPEQRAALDEVAASIVTTVNALHQAGTGLDGSTGNSLFDPAGVTATSFALSADVAGQPDRLAASDGSGALDNSVALAIAALGTDPTGPSSVQADFIANLGNRVKTLSDRSETASLGAQYAQNANQSQVGVNLDEELADLVIAQRAYEASSRMISAVDEMLDVLINRTGLVGR